MTTFRKFLSLQNLIYKDIEEKSKTVLYKGLKLIRIFYRISRDI